MLDFRILIFLIPGVISTYITSPSQAQISQYTPQLCSTTDASSVCCQAQSFWNTNSWTDQTMNIVTTNYFTCYRDNNNNEWVHIISSGLPNHPYATPISVSTQSIDYLIKINPYADPNAIYPSQNICSTSTMGMGIVGIATNGVALFSPLSMQSVDPFYPPFGYSAENVDLCMAHPNNFGTYHYHMASPCLMGTTLSEPIGNTACYSSLTSSCVNKFSGTGNVMAKNCVKNCDSGVGFSKGSSNIPIGIYFNGYFVYGPYDDSGNSIKGLDQCNGKFVNGIYQYYSTSTFPYMAGCNGPGSYTASLPTCTANPPQSYSKETRKNLRN